MNPLDIKALLSAAALSALLFAAVAYFTRAARRRIIGVLIGAIASIPLLLFNHWLAAKMGWWETPPMPPAGLFSAALVFWGAFGLIGWRVIRRWGTPGLIVFLVLYSLLGLASDFGYASSGLVVFGPAPMSYFTDLLAYASTAVLVQLVMRLIAGPAGSDALARTLMTTN